MGLVYGNAVRVLVWLGSDPLGGLFEYNLDNSDNPELGCATGTHGWGF
jgi:hypothetical protein